jgi:cell division transport system ATP-binding protein
MNSDINLKEKAVSNSEENYSSKDQKSEMKQSVKAEIPAEEKKLKEEVKEKQANTKIAPSSCEEPVIVFKKVFRTYAGNIKAVDNVSFSICPGEFISLVGPSGAGKSTLIKMLIGEEKPTSGEVLVAGRDIAKLEKNEIPYFRRKVGVIFQDFKLLPKKTVYENIAFALEVADLRTSEINERVPQIIEIVGLTSRSKAMSEELSGGEKQRVSIARALVHTPKLLIADEPTGNLDPVSTWEIIELLFKINKQGTIVLLATHDKEVVDALSRRVITMRAGKIFSDQSKGKYLL